MTTVGAVQFVNVSPAINCLQSRSDSGYPFIFVNFSATTNLLSRTEMRTRERNDTRYEQFEISPETIEQELRLVVCEQ